mmetsp:Transcript_69667/g.163914  ORF Transcript_69667/g.163914 Transcript_69667/m.163914 type:complete len:389 (-) Transcript_69667:1359-2525(-)
MCHTLGAVGEGRVQVHVAQVDGIVDRKANENDNGDGFSCTERPIHGVLAHAHDGGDDAGDGDNAVRSHNDVARGKGEHQEGQREAQRNALDGILQGRLLAAHLDPRKRVRGVLGVAGGAGLVLEVAHQVVDKIVDGLGGPMGLVTTQRQLEVEGGKLDLAVQHPDIGLVSRASGGVEEGGHGGDEVGVGGVGPVVPRLVRLGEARGHLGDQLATLATPLVARFIGELIAHALHKGEVGGGVGGERGGEVVVPLHVGSVVGVPPLELRLLGSVNAPHHRQRHQPVLVGCAELVLHVVDEALHGVRVREPLLVLGGRLQQEGLPERQRQDEHEHQDDRVLDFVAIEDGCDLVAEKRLDAGELLEVGVVDVGQRLARTAEAPPEAMVLPPP